MTITGTINSEFTIDGSSNVVSQARAGIQPPSDAIEEFKVETAAYDAQIGHTGAGAVNLALKSGTNQFHGAGSFYNRDDSRSANLFASNRNGSGKIAAQLQPVQRHHRRPDLQEQDVLHVLVREAAGRHDRVVHQLGADGEDAHGRLLGAAERSACRFTIRAPARLVNGVVDARSVPGQHHPGRQDQPGRAQRARVSSRRRTRRRPPTSRRTSSPSSRGPTATTSRWRASITSGRPASAPTAASSATSGARSGTTSPARSTASRSRAAPPIASTSTTPFGHTAVLSPTMVLDVKGSWLRFNDDLFPLYDDRSGEPRVLRRRRWRCSATTSTCRASASSRASPTTAGRVATLGAQQSGFNTGRTQPFYNLQFAPTLTKTTGAHTFKFGYDWRQLRQTETNLGWKGGAYAFDGDLHARRPAPPRASTARASRRSCSGLPLRTRRSSRRAATYDCARQQPRRLRPRRLARVRSADAEPRRPLRPRAGHDRSGEPQHRRLRSHDAEPDPGAGARATSRRIRRRACRSRRQPVRRCAAATRICPTISGARGTPTRNNFQPRAGFTYKLSDASVLRGGVGLFIAPFQIQGVPGITTALNQIGYSRNTPVPVTSDNGLTFQANLTNPVPSGQLLAPVGSSLGLATNLGNAPGNVTLARSHQPGVLALQPRHRAPAPRRLPRRGVVPRPAGTTPADPRAAELRAASSSARRARFATPHAETFLSQVVVESVRQG